MADQVPASHKQPNIKPYALLGTARSGSTPFFRLTSQYIQQHSNQLDAHEFLIYLGQKYKINKDYSIEYWGAGISDPARLPGFGSPQFHKRLNFIRKNYHRYYLKFFASMMTPDVQRWAMDSYQWLLIERRDLFQQLLSRLISKLTNHWYSNEGTNLLQNSLIAPCREDGRCVYIDFFAEEMITYFQIKNYLGDRARTVYYEDFVTQPVEITLEKIGFSQPFDITKFEWTCRQNPMDKSSIFKNIGEIQQCYRATVLQSFCPIK